LAFQLEKRKTEGVELRFVGLGGPLYLKNFVLDEKL